MWVLSVFWCVEGAGDDMAIFNMKDPIGPKLIGFCTVQENAERFKSVSASHIPGRVSCVVRLNPHHEAHFSMTPEHAREVAVKLIDAAESAEFQQDEHARKETERQNERVRMRESKRIKQRISKLRNREGMPNE